MRCDLTARIANTRFAEPSRCSLMLGLRPDTTRLYNNSMSTPISPLFSRRSHPAADVQKRWLFFRTRRKNISLRRARPNRHERHRRPALVESSRKSLGTRSRSDQDEVIKLIPNYKNLGGTLCWMQARGADEEQTDGKVATETIKMLETNKDKPFFIGCGFYRPHVPDIAIKKWFDLYPLEEIQLPKEPEHVAGIPPIALTVKPTNFGLEPIKLREFKRAYFAATSFVDAQAGRVLDALHRLKLDDNTIVVIWSDHGWCLGEHGQWQKQLLFEESARVVLMMRQPGANGNGKPCFRTVELLDLH